MLRLKGFADICGIYASGMIAGSFLNDVAGIIRAGVSTEDINRFAADYIGSRGASAAFLNYNGYPGSVCTSINEEIVHGIPSTQRVLQDGDIVSVDVGVTLAGYVSDTARTYFVGPGEPPPNVARLLTATRESLDEGIKAVAAGQKIRKVSQAIERRLAGAGLGIFDELTGHGVGFAVHEEPTIYNVDQGGRETMQNGLVIAIEPMASLGSSKILLSRDRWTYVTADGSLAAHYEHTVGIWDGRAFVLTDPADEAARAMFAKTAQPAR